MERQVVIENAYECVLGRGRGRRDEGGARSTPQT